MIFFTAIRQW